MTPLSAQHITPALCERDIAERLAIHGAVITIWHSPPERFLVGAFAWLTPCRIFWFAANGDKREDGHVLDFDDVAMSEEGLLFSKDGRHVGHIASIDLARTDERDDFRVAWQIWQDVAPARLSLIAAAKAALLV